MKTILSLLLLLFMTGCASRGDLLSRDVSPDQTYRPKGSDKAITISGHLDRTYASYGLEYKTLYISFDGVLGITGNLGEGYNGELSGTWLDKPVSTSCSGRPVSETWTDVRCIVFIENERTVTLTF